MKLNDTRSTIWCAANIMLKCGDDNAKAESARLSDELAVDGDDAGVAGGRRSSVQSGSSLTRHLPDLEPFDRANRQLVRDEVWPPQRSLGDPPQVN
jgi:hypothetical protein